MEKTEKLLHQNIFKVFLGYLLPTVMGMITHSLYCLADVMFIGVYVGSTALAAMNICMPIFTLFTSIGLLIGVGASTTIMVKLGQGDHEGPNKIFSLAIVSNLIVGITVSVLSTLFLEPFARFLGATDQLMPYVAQYMMPINCTCFAFIFSSMLQVLIRADYNPRLVMIATVTGNLFNIVFDYVFMAKMNMGIFGASLATAISPFIALALMSLHYILKNNTLHFTKDCFDLALLKRILQNGIGTFCLEFTSGMIIFVFNIVLLRISGELAIACYTIISNIAYVGKGIFNGIAQATQPLISANYGAEQYNRSQRAAKISIITSIVFSTVVFILVLLVPRQIAGFFSEDMALIEACVPAMKLYFVSFAFTGINTMLMYYFQSIERAKISTVIALSRGIVLVLVGIILLTPVLGENGVWLTITFAELGTLAFAYPYKRMVDHRQLQKNVSFHVAEIAAK